MRNKGVVFINGCLENYDLESDDLENEDLENEDLENYDLESDDLEFSAATMFSHTCPLSGLLIATSCSRVH